MAELDARRRPGDRGASDRPTQAVDRTTQTGVPAGRRVTASVAARATAAPLVLLVVLASHVSLRWSSDLTPWKGGGFGMFSTVDSPASRVLRIELDTDVGIVPVAIPSGLRDLASAAKTAPSTGRLVHLAEAVAEQWWVVPQIASLTGAGADEDQRLREVAVEALSQVLPVESVQAIDPARFDEANHRRLDVRGVTVVVLRLDPDAADDETDGAEVQVLRPEQIRGVTLNFIRRDGEVAR